MVIIKINWGITLLLGSLIPLHVCALFNNAGWISFHTKGLIQTMALLVFFILTVLLAREQRIRVYYKILIIVFAYALIIFSTNILLSL